MDYEMAFYILLAFLAGNLTKGGIYIGKDEDIYNKAAIGMLFKK